VLQFPSAWIAHYGANILTAYPPDIGARFRFHERVTPQPSLAAIASRTLDSDSLFLVQSFGDMTRIVTHEGEYGAWVGLGGTREGSRARMLVGAVFLDEFATVLVGLALIPEYFDEVQNHFVEMLRTQQHDYTHRPRRFFYQPPPGWHGLPSGTTANWYPLDFPKNLTNIVVPPASRVEGDGTREIETAIAHCEVGLSIDATTRAEIVSVGGVRGTLARVLGKRAGRAEPIHRELAAFVTGGHLYRMRLETTNATRALEIQDIFRAVARSFRPLPTLEERRTGQPFAAPSSAFEHWVS
jgi:hypothetical protein